MIITTVFVTPCALLGEHVTPAMVMVHAMMDFVIVTKTGLTMDVGNVSKLAPVRLFVLDMEPVNCMETHPGVYVRMGGMDHPVISLARGYPLWVYHAITGVYVM